MIVPDPAPSGGMMNAKLPRVLSCLTLAGVAATACDVQTVDDRFAEVEVVTAERSGDAERVDFEVDGEAYHAEALAMPHGRQVSLYNDHVDAVAFAYESGDEQIVTEAAADGEVVPLDPAMLTAEEQAALDFALEGDWRTDSGFRAASGWGGWGGTGGVFSCQDQCEHSKIICEFLNATAGPNDALRLCDAEYDWCIAGCGNAYYWSFF